MLVLKAKTYIFWAISIRSFDTHSSLSFFKPAITYNLTAFAGLFVSLYTICNVIIFFNVDLDLSIVNS